MLRLKPSPLLLPARGEAGFDPVDAGARKAARYIEPFTMLIALLAYEGEGGPELAYRFEHIG